MDIDKLERDHVGHDFVVAKYSRYILAELRRASPELIGWYADWDTYFDDAIDRICLIDVENNAARLQGLPLMYRLYVDSSDERIREYENARKGLSKTLRVGGFSEFEAYELYCEAMQSFVQEPPEGLIAEVKVFTSFLFKVRDPITGSEYRAGA